MSNRLISVQPAHSLKVLQLSSDFDCHPILDKFEIIQLQREDLAAKSRRKMLLIL